MNKTLRSAHELKDAGLINAAAMPAIAEVAARYAVAITPALARRIDAADPADPLARQFVPSPAELLTEPEELADPIGDDAHSPVEGIVHRYPDRALLKLVHVCPVYCRFCFRREFVGPGRPHALSAEALDRALRHIAETPALWEIVLTGGDPLILSARRLEALARRLATIEHVKILRIHSRVPLLDPARIDAALIAALKASGKTVYVAVHANHAREFSGEGRAAIARLADAGIPLLGQTVLLRGVNDDAETMGALMRMMVENRIKPYYLHHPDLAPGTSHFRVAIEDGQALMQALRGRWSGLCQPLYVLDIAGGAGKVPIGPGYAEQMGEGWRVTDPNGVEHPYPPAGSIAISQK